jgi:deltex-like protein
MLHKGCLKNMIGDKKWIRCPVCSTIFGVMVGDQPPGTMTWYAANGMECDGYPGVNTTVINYSMKSGTRNGVAFDGTSRRAYLPDTPEGNEVLKLLKLAFDRKLIFTVGTSVTTGRDNCVVWNGIHHKTNTHGGSSSFGYPDPTYFQRVKLELAAKGIY